MCGSNCVECKNGCNGKEWKSAILEELLLWGLSTPEIRKDPALAIKALIDWNVALALDPLISEQAKALQETAFDYAGEIRSAGLGEVRFKGPIPPEGTTLYTKK